MVPFTRGRDVSRSPESILREARSAVRHGARETMRLGQNVNSYRAGETGFAEILQAVADVEGLRRLRFKSPHPNNWNHNLSETLTENPVICDQLHLPFQSGANRAP